MNCRRHAQRNGQPSISGNRDGSVDERRGTYGMHPEQGSNGGWPQRNNCVAARSARVQPGSAQAEEEESQSGESQRQIRGRSLAMTHDGKRGAFLARDQLGLRHAARNRMRWVVERKLVREAPGKDTEPEQHEPEAEHAEPATAAGKPIVTVNVGNVG